MNDTPPTTPAPPALPPSAMRPSAAAAVPILDYGRPKTVDWSLGLRREDCAGLAAFVLVFAVGTLLVAMVVRYDEASRNLVLCCTLVIASVVRRAARRTVSVSPNVNRTLDERLALGLSLAAALLLLFGSLDLHSDRWGTTWRIGPAGMAHTQIGPTGPNVGRADWWCVRDGLWVWIRYGHAS